MTSSMHSRQSAISQEASTGLDLQGCPQSVMRGLLRISKQICNQRLIKQDNLRTEHSSPSKTVCLSLSMSSCRFSGAREAIDLGGASLTIPLAGKRISVRKDCGTKLEDRHSWRTDISFDST